MFALNLYSKFCGAQHTPLENPAPCTYTAHARIKVDCTLIVFNHQFL